MKTIKIFLASSEELTDDRNAFGNLVRRLDKIYEKRGIRIELFEWEDYDSAFNDQRKQDEYNERVRESDVFLALFHKKAGAFTVELGDYIANSGIDYWIYGHSHRNIKAQIGDTLILSNQLGYVSHGEHLVNGFAPGRVIEVS